jgi:glycosyltransferase 2 family protein
LAIFKTNIIRFLGLIILGVILTKVEWDQFVKATQMADQRLLVLCLPINLLTVWIKSARWRLILSMQGHPIKRLESFSICLSATFLSWITPGRLGDIARVIYVKQYNITNASRALSSVLIDRLFDICLYFVIAFFGLLIITPHLMANNWGWVGIFVIAAILSIYILVKKHSKIESLFQSNKFFLKNSIDFSKWLKPFFEGIKDVQGKGLAKVLVFTIFGNVIFFYQFFLISKAFSISIPFFELTSIIAITSLASLLPITISGIGIREAILLYFFDPMGINFETTIAFSMGALLVIYIGGALFGAVAFWLRPLDINLKKQER